jgi:hypothetical protein
VKPSGAAGAVDDHRNHPKFYVFLFSILRAIEPLYGAFGRAVLDYLWLTFRATRET